MRCNLAFILPLGCIVVNRFYKIVVIFYNCDILSVGGLSKMLKLYENIKARREALGMTQTELALKTGYADKSTISRIEKGKVDLSQSKIEAFAKALRTTANDLMGYDADVLVELTPEAQAVIELVDLAETCTEDQVRRAAQYLSFLKQQEGGKI